jgi:hypothetical protein
MDAFPVGNSNEPREPNKSCSTDQPTNVKRNAEELRHHSSILYLYQVLLQTIGC